MTKGEMKFQKIAVLAFVALFIIGIVPAIKPVNAGTSRSYVVTENSIEDGSVNGGDIIVFGNVQAEGNYAVFNEESDNYSKLLMKTKIYNMKKYGVSELMNAKIKMSISKFAEGGTISLNFGLNGLQLGPGSKDSFNIIFTENKERSGVNVGIYEYTEEGVKEIRSSTYSASASDNKIFEICVRVDSERHIFIKINDITIVDNYKLETDPCGYISVVSDGNSGKNIFKAGKMDIYGYRYDSPENVDYIETFDNDGYNSNMFFSQSISGVVSPSGLYVKDGKLRFENATGASFLTKYKYSNFSIEYDLSDIAKVAEQDANGNWTKIMSSWYAICFGVDDYKQSAAVTEALESCLILEYKSVESDKSIWYDGTFKRYLPKISGNYRLEGVSLVNSYDCWDPNRFPEDTVFNIKFIVKDGVMQFYAKTSKDADFTEKPLFEYDAGVTDMGYVGFFTSTENSISSRGFQYTNMANFSIDNFKVTNLDYNGETLPAPEFKSNKKDRTPDYAYTTKPDDSDLLDSKIENGTQGESGGCNASVDSFYLPVAVVVFLVAFLTINVKRRNRE